MHADYIYIVDVECSLGDELVVDLFEVLPTYASFLNTSCLLPQVVTYQLPTLGYNLRNY
jgi:hypothetical protein